MWDVLIFGETDPAVIVGWDGDGVEIFPRPAVPKADLILDDKCHKNTR